MTFETLNTFTCFGFKGSEIRLFSEIHIGVAASQ